MHAPPLSTAPALWKAMRSTAPDLDDDTALRLLLDTVATRRAGAKSAADRLGFAARMGDPTPTAAACEGPPGGRRGCFAARL